MGVVGLVVSQGHSPRSPVWANFWTPALPRVVKSRDRVAPLANGHALGARGHVTVYAPVVVMLIRQFWLRSDLDSSCGGVSRSCSQACTCLLRGLIVGNESPCQVGQPHSQALISH